jgi:hypothetical protein
MSAAQLLTPQKTHPETSGEMREAMVDAEEKLLAALRDANPDHPLIAVRGPAGTD